MIVNSREKYFELFESKKIGLLVFNKDTRSLVKFYNENLKVINFTIEYIIDLTLGYRKKVREIAEGIFNKKKIITDIERVQHILDNREIDILLSFDAGYEKAEEHNSGTLYKRNIQNFQGCHEVLHADFQNYKKMTKSAEFNFRWSRYVIDYINIYASENGIYIASAYWDNMSPRQSSLLLGKKVRSEQFVKIERMGLLELLPDIEKDFDKAKIRIIVGSDWGSGKTTFLYNRMKKGSFGVAGDSWFSLVSKSFIPLLYMQDFFAIKGIIANEVYRAWKQDPDKEIYVKLDGRLEEFVYGFPRDRRYMIDSLHKYFKKIKFILVLKPEQTIESIQDMYDNFKSYYNISKNIEVYKMNYNGTEDRIL